jgi:hypothetical protein
MKGFNSSFLITLIMTTAIVLIAKMTIQSEQIASFDSVVLNGNSIYQVLTVRNR